MTDLTIQRFMLSVQSICVVEIIFGNFEKLLFFNRKSPLENRNSPMPVNRNALIRFKTIDACLRNRYRKWTLEDLIEKVSDAMYEYEGMDKGISRRTV